MNGRIRQLPSGVWQADVRGPNGQRYRWSTNTKSEAVAQQRLSLYLAGQTGTPAPELDVDGLVSWYTDVCLAQAAPGTLSSAKYQLGKFSEWARGRGYGLKEALTAGSVLEWSAALGKTLSANTTKGIVTRLHIMVNHAVRYGILVSDPVRNWPVIRHKRPMIDVYTPEQVNAVLEFAAATEPEMLPVIQFEAATGVRRSDVVRLRWEWVDLKARRMRFDQYKTGGRLDCGINDMAVEALIAVGQQVRGEVWPWLCGWKLDRFYRRANAALPFHCNSHKFRHTVGVMLAEAGATLPIIASVLGHKSIATTIVYQHARFGSESLPLASVSSRLQSAKNSAKTLPESGVSR